VETTAMLQRKGSWDGHSTNPSSC